MTFGIAGLSVVADSLSAIEHARVEVIRDPSGLAVDYRICGDFPKFGNDDQRVDRFATEVAEAFIARLRQRPTYRGAEHTQSILTMSSNIVYGKNTGNTPDGRRAGAPFAAGANPMPQRGEQGLIPAARSVAKLPFEACQDGIEMTVCIEPGELGGAAAPRVQRLASALDKLFDLGLFHIHVKTGRSTRYDLGSRRSSSQYFRSKALADEEP
jgi:formate C-acetyltransferase